MPDTLAAHVQVLDDRFRNQTLKVLVDQYVGNESDPGKKRGLRERLTADLSSPPGSLTFEDEFSRCLNSLLRPFREQRAETEIRAKWPRVADLSFEWGDDDLEMLHGDEAEKLASNQRLLPGGNMNMEEAREKFAEAKMELIKEGKRIIDKQVALVEDSSRSGTFIEMIPHSRQQELEAKYEADVVKAWGDERTPLLSKLDGRVSNPTKYDRLFKLSKRRVNEILTREYEKSHSQEKVVVGSSGDKVGPGRGPGPGGGESGAGGGGGGGGGGSCPPTSAAFPWMSTVGLIAAAFALGAFALGVGFGRWFTRRRPA